MLTQEQIETIERPGVLPALREFAFSDENTPVAPEVFKLILQLLQSTEKNPQQIIKEYEAAKGLS